MSGAVLEKVPLMGGELEICRFANKPKYWYFRMYVRASGNQKRTYIKRTLRTEDRAEAERRAYEEWRKLKTLQEDGGAVTAKKLQDLMDDWIEKSWQRVVTGEIEEVTWKSKRSFFTNALKNFFKAKGYKRITDLQQDSFEDYRYWRLTEGWKFFDIKDKSKRKPPTDGTINSEVGLINEWFNNYLIPKGYARRKPSSLKRKELDYDDLSANPPIPLKEWEMVWRWMDRWTKDDAKGINRPAVQYWRMCFRHYLLVAYNSGCRPTELIGRFSKQKKVIDRGMTWADVEIVPQTRWSPKLKKEIEDKPIAFLEIRKTKTGVPRTVPCRSATYLERWWEFTTKWREENGYEQPKADELVFANPKTGKPYSYTMFSRAWDVIRKDLGDAFSNEFTLYSTRSSFVTNLLEEGVSRDDVCKLTGHSYSVMTRHYDRMKMRNRIPEVTKRTLGRRYEHTPGTKKFV